MAETATVRSEVASSRPKIAFLEAVRGVAALIVVLQHILAAQSPAFEQWSREYVDFGRVGVVAFFVVSGYVIPLSLEHQSPKVFVIRRAFRLFPLYLVTLAAFLLVFALIPSTNSENVTATAVVLAVNILMLQGITPLATIVPTAWTLGIELVFYAQEFFAKIVKKLSESVYLGYVWLGLFAAVQVACRVLGRDIPSTPLLLLYTAAIGQALFLKDHHGGRAWKPLIVVGVIAAPLFTFIGGNHDATWPPLTYSASYLVGLLLFAAFYLFAKKTVHPVLVWLGGVSYAIYLIHPLAYRLVALSGLNPVIIVALSIAATMLVSWLLHKYVELPFISLGRRVSASGSARHSRSTRSTSSSSSS